jgi:DNA-directed RNA polymerase subunit RPC12/RpoP
MKWRQRKMVVDSGYMCKTCGKIYHKQQRDIPIYCKKCGQDLVEERYFYNLIEYRGKVVETRGTNIFGGYDYVKTTLTKNVGRVKIKKKFFGWELFDKAKEA